MTPRTHHQSHTMSQRRGAYETHPFFFSKRQHECRGNRRRRLPSIDASVVHAAIISHATRESDICCIAAAWEKARTTNPPSKHWLRLLKPAQAPSKSAALELVPLTTVWRAPFHIRTACRITLRLFYCRAAVECPMAFRAGAWSRHLCNSENVPRRFQPKRIPRPSFALHPLIFVLYQPHAHLFCHITPFLRRDSLAAPRLHQDFRAGIS